MHAHRSARHLDDPLRPFAGLTVGQVLSLLLGGGAGFAAYKLLSRLPTRNGAALEGYIFVVVAVAAGVAGLGMLLAGGQGEPFGAQLAAYVRRRHRYAPRAIQVAGRGRIRGILHKRAAADSLRLLPVRVKAHGQRPGGLRVDQDGVVSLPNGELLLYLAVEPVNFDCCSPEDRDQFAALWASVASLLPPGQRLQVLVENRPLSAGPILERIRHDLRPASPPLRAFVDESMALWEKQLVRGHVPDHRFTLVLVPGPNRLRKLGRAVRSPERDLAAARRNLDELARTIEHKLKRRRMGCRRLRGDEAVALVWDSLHPSGTPFPTLAFLRPNDAAATSDPGSSMPGAAAGAPGD